MHLSISAYSISLAKREGVNEDFLGVLRANDGTQVLGIADGVGSSVDAQFAAQSAIELSFKMISDNPKISGAEIFENVHEFLLEHAKSKYDGGMLATTLTICRIKDDVAKVHHVGDCRLYHLRGHGIVARTKDQSELQRLIDEGVIPRIRANRYPRKNVLLSVLGSKSGYKLDETVFNLESSDRVLMLSDGAYRLLPRLRIRDESLHTPTLRGLYERLTTILNSFELEDDASILLAEAVLSKIDQEVESRVVA